MNKNSLIENRALNGILTDCSPNWGGQQYRSGPPAGRTHENTRANRIFPGSIPVPGVVSGVLAGKSCRRDANPDTRDACAPQQKRLAREKYALWKRDPGHPSLKFEERLNGLHRSDKWCTLLQ